MFAQPVGVFFREQREIKELVAEFTAQIIFPGQRAEFGGAELVLLQFRQQRAEFLRKAGAAGAAAKQL